MERTLHSLPRVSLVFSGSLSVSLSPPTGKCNTSSMSHAASKKDPIKEGDAMSLPLFYFYYRDCTLCLYVLYTVWFNRRDEMKRKERRRRRMKRKRLRTRCDFDFSDRVFSLSCIFLLFLPSFFTGNFVETQTDLPSVYMSVFFLFCCMMLLLSFYVFMSRGWVEKDFLSIPSLLLFTLDSRSFCATIASN